MNFKMATLASLGITFYDELIKEKIDPKSITAASESESELQNYMEEDCSSSSDHQQIRAAAVSPRLSDILHEFSVPQGIVPIKESIEHADQELVQECVHCDQCSTVETPTERTKDDTETLQDSSEESIAIDDESMPVEPALEKPNRRGRKRLPKEKVIPGEWYCKLCDKNFMSKGGLSQHTNARHAKNRTHLCDICNKRFEYSQDMEEHRARHSADNKPHECSFKGCNRRFMYRFDLNRHFMQNHGNVMYHCTICAKGFVRKDHLVKHLISHKNKTVMKISIKQM